MEVASEGRKLAENVVNDAVLTEPVSDPEIPVMQRLTGNVRKFSRKLRLTSGGDPQ